MIHSHVRIRAAVRTRAITKARSRAELLVANLIGQLLIKDLSSQMHRAMVLDTAINNRVRNQQFTTALIWAVTYLDSIEEDDVPRNHDEAKVVASTVFNYMEQRSCISAT